jgi:SAM-dependent methyltransferase
MSGFSREWLALREAADHRSRSAALVSALAGHLAGHGALRIVDVGCGTGSNLRATSARLGPSQHWTLVDHDPALIAAARERLAAWADRAEPAGERLVLWKGGREIAVAFREADLDRDLDRALGSEVHLVTASALFDLCSEAFIARFAAAVAARRAAFFTVLTYDGDQRWTPAHESDAAMLAAFHAHQRSDKGLGASAGPAAPGALAGAFRARGYDVREGDSSWRLDAADPGDRELISSLAAGFADAVAETGRIDARILAAWRSLARTAAIVGHTDTLALPPG